MLETFSLSYPSRIIFGRDALGRLPSCLPKAPQFFLSQAEV